MKHAIIDTMQMIEKGMIKLETSQYNYLMLDVEKQADFFRNGIVSLVGERNGDFQVQGIAYLKLFRENTKGFHLQQLLEHFQERSISRRGGSWLPAQGPQVSDSTSRGIALPAAPCKGC